MEKIWLAHYPEGIPEHIDPDTIPSLKALLEDACRQHGDSTAFVNMGAAMSFAELERQSRSLAAFLQQRAGLARGDRVALMMPNLLQYPAALFAVLRAGLVAVNVNPLYTAPELEHQLRDSGARAIVVLENFCATLEKVVQKTDVQTIITTQIGDAFPWLKRSATNLVVKRIKRMVPAWSLPGHLQWRGVLQQGEELTFEDVSVGADDIAFLQYTGGTTGKAKGAMLTHRNMVANMLQASAWLRAGNIDNRDLVVTALPLYHIFSLTVNLLLFIHLGARNLLITNPRDMPGFVKELAREPFSVITGVNTLFIGLMNTHGFSDLDFKRLRITVGGGMAVQQPVAERWQKITGCVLLQGYGLTETSPAVSMSPLDAKSFDGSIGLPLPSTEISIRDEQGNELPVGELGEICVRGPQVMRGYWNQPEETAGVMLEGGWLRTGDIGRMDEEGRTSIEDRKKDMIVVSGFNVYPNEVENVVQGLEGVLECAAVAMPHKRSGEAVKLFVVRKDPNLTEEQILAHCRESLTNYKVPRSVEFRDELPKTNVGKILRRALRDELWNAEDEKNRQAAG